MTAIKSIHAREILDSRGNPTLEAEVSLVSGGFGRAAVPSGASTGTREAVELRDGDATRYMGKGVRDAVANVNGTISDVLTGFDATEQRALDERLINLDGTANKTALGANAILGASLAAAKAVADHRGQAFWQMIAGQGPTSLPVPMMNIINGGAHADNSVDMQEFMILPVGASSFSEALRCGTEIFHALKSTLNAAGLSTAVGDEGGFAPDLPSNVAAVEVILKAIELAGYKAGSDVYLGLDVAASEFYRDGHYNLESEGKQYDSAGFTEYLADWVRQFPIISIEDGMAEDDWAGWALHTKSLGQDIQLVGDDLFVTNTRILQRGIVESICN